MYVILIERPLALNQARQSNLFLAYQQCKALLIHAWYSLNFSFTKKYVRKLDKLTLSALCAMDRVNVSVSSIFTVANYGPRGVSST
jgi:hypothetical protein